MSTQTVLKNINAQIKKSKSPVVVLSLKEWQHIEDVIRELSSPKLLKTVTQAREDYKKGKAVAYIFSK